MVEEYDGLEVEWAWGKVIGQVKCYGMFLRSLDSVMIFMRDLLRLLFPGPTNECIRHFVHVNT